MKVSPSETTVTPARQWAELRRLKHKLTDFILYSDTDLLELQSGLMSLLWGIWVLNPWSNALSRSPGYQTVATWLPEWALGIGVVSAGLLQLIGLFAHRIQARRNGNLMAIFFWLFLAALSLIGNDISPTLILFISMAITSALVYIRTGCYFTAKI